MYVKLHLLFVLQKSLFVTATILEILKILFLLLVRVAVPHLQIFTAQTIVIV